MKFTVKDHLLYRDGVKVKQIPSPNHSGRIVPQIIVIHYTGDNSFMGAVSWLCNPSAKVSAHLVIAKDGLVYQLLPFNVCGWHAGRSEYNGEPNVNGFSVGIENVGTGDSWPDEQVETIRAVCVALSERYEIEDIVGHEDVAIPEGRKSDPGVNFPWEKVTD